MADDYVVEDQDELDARIAASAGGEDSKGHCM